MILAELAADLARAADALRRVTVEIRVGRRGLGAGVAWPASGSATARTIVTNAHVVGRRRSCVVGFADGGQRDGRVVRTDEENDLALIEVSGAELEPAVLGDAAQLRAGEVVLALGHPFGLSGALALGIVHLADERWIRADLRLAPGFSGGPLADAAGRIVGLNAMIAHGLGLAVPAAAIEKFLQVPAPATEAA